MSSESEVDDFFDAMDESPGGKSQTLKASRPVIAAQVSSDSIDDSSESTSGSKSTEAAVAATPAEAAAELEARRTKLRRLRKCVTGDEEVAEPPSPHGSQTDSVEGVAARSSHPFRKVEHDAQSMVSQMSLGKVGRIMAGLDDIDGPAGRPPSAAASSTPPPAADAAPAPAPAQADVPPQAQRAAAELMPPPPAPPPPPPEAEREAGPPPVAAQPPAEPVPPSPPPPPLPLPVPDIVSSVKLAGPRPASPPPPPPPLLPPPPQDSAAPPVAPPRRRKKRPPQDGARDSASSLGSAPPEEPPREPPREPAPARPRASPPPVRRGPELRPPHSATGSLRQRRRGLTDRRAQLTPDRDQEFSLDIRSATKGQYVVKPQDEESTRAPVVTVMDRLDVISVQSDASSIADSVASSYPGANMQRLDEVKEAQEFLRSHEIQTNIFVKTKTDSGRPLTDKEILDQVSVLNLDTGERIPLSVAEEKLPACINPLSLQIMRMTSEYIREPDPVPDSPPWPVPQRRRRRPPGCVCSLSLNMYVCACGHAPWPAADGAPPHDENLPAPADDTTSSLEKDGSDDDKKSLVIPPAEEQVEQGGVRKKTAQFRRFLGRTVNKARDRAEVIAQKMSHVRHREERDAFESLDGVADAHTVIRVPMKASSSHKGPYEFDQLLFVQDFKSEHIGPVWCMKFSACGRLLATAGQDHVLRVWVLKSAYHYFCDMRTKYSAEKVSPTPSQESLVSHHSSEEPLASVDATCEEEAYAPFMSRPLCKYTGHTADLLDISWSKNYFILSSSMDKTVRLWHISRKECLCCFQHIEFVTAIAFHPKDDRYFLSGSLDGKLRLWNIPDKKVALWNELDGQAKLITAANFCQGGRFAVVGSYDGRCLFYSTDQLKYHTQIHVRSTRGKNARGRKISGIEPMPGEDKILVTSNDSRIRLYDLRDLNLSCKYKGFTNTSSQIRGSFSHDGKYIVVGSENQCVYIWKTHHDYSKFSSARRDRNDFWEGIKAHEAQVTCALFAPHPDLIFSHVDGELTRLEQERGERGSQSSASPDPTPPAEDAKKDSLDKKSVGSGGTSTMGYVLVTADFNGIIKVFLNRTRPKHSSLPASALMREAPATPR
ncbi:WD repeat-containing protein 44-like isoform X2 [Amphibalanus amphitrite]|nr:WD repeat-containing protein 44-like isoform X2 [Amphibalanus amphitrite]